MNNNLERARAYIDCYNKNHPNNGCCCCFGPTGPTGPTGPASATITVSTTTTSDPGSAASVVNVGTSSNAILEFTIPRGATGPTGATGATGGGLAAYGGLYNSATQTPTLTTANTFVPLELNTALPLLNTTDSTNSITVTEAGVYEISYNIDLTATAELTFSAEARQNTTAITPTITTVTATVTTTGGGTFNATLTTSALVNLSASDVIDLALTTTGTPSGTTTVQANGSCILVVKKVND